MDQESGWAHAPKRNAAPRNVSLDRRQLLRGGAALGIGVAGSATIARMVANAQDSSAAATVSDATGVNAGIVVAGSAFLATLSDDERAAGLFDFSDMEQRQRWSNFPQMGFQRAGLMWGDLSEASQNAWLALMQATLSDSGYEQVMEEWAADDALKGTENNGGGGNSGFGREFFYIALIGAPSDTDPWQWQWGGHHVTVNATIVGDNIALVPSFIGVQPATYADANGNTVQPLEPINEAGFALVNALTDDQKQQAILGDTYIDLVLGPGQDGKKIQPEGLLTSELDADQQQLLVDLVSFYTGLVNDEHAAARLAEVTDVLDQTYFVWYGPTELGSAAYFRVAGPTIVIEFSPQNQDGDATQHIHGMYRDPSNDYGVKFTG